MSTYIVVHHKKDTKQPWVNSWLDDDRLAAIQTNGQVANLCSDVHREGQPVFVHRCAFASFSPIICCSASVTSVQKIDRKTYFYKRAVSSVFNRIVSVLINLCLFIKPDFDCKSEAL